MANRVNRAIELLEADQAIYYDGPHTGHVLTYEQGRKDAKTWADYINVGMEHGAFDMTALEQYMRGLVDGGPTNSSLTRGSWTKTCMSGVQSYPTPPLSASNFDPTSKSPLVSWRSVPEVTAPLERLLRDKLEGDPDAPREAFSGWEGLESGRPPAGDGPRVELWQIGEPEQTLSAEAARRAEAERCATREVVHRPRADRGMRRIAAARERADQRLESLWRARAIDAVLQAPADTITYHQIKSTVEGIKVSGLAAHLAAVSTLLNRLGRQLTGDTLARVVHLAALPADGVQSVRFEINLKPRVSVGTANGS